MSTRRITLGIIGLAWVMVRIGIEEPSRARGHAPSANRTLVLQQGLAGYAGVRDTWISAAGWASPPQHSVNYGQNHALTLTRGGNDNPMLGFDLSAIPANSAVVSATLALYNATPGACSSPGTRARRVQAFSMLRDWDEGNQVQAAVASTIGARGATGDHAFLYYSGGVNVPWGARGMSAGTDYAAAPESFSDVLNEGWYSWTVTSLVRAWVRGEKNNYGITLRDATGYQDGNCDSRIFQSSQSATAARRPMLTLVYNPDVPFADAGPDQSMLNWPGSPVTLDGSASHDRPGGNDAALSYQWRLVQAAYGSALGGNMSPAGKIISFTPDVAGEWEIELTVTNNVGESAADRVHLRLLSIPVGHPRIFLTPAKLAALQTRAVPSNSRWTQLQSEANNPGGGMHAKALVSLVTGQASYCSQAVAAAATLIADPGDNSTKGGDIALIYDWCNAQLSPAQRTTFVNYFNTWAAATHGEEVPGWGNYWPRYGYSYSLIGVATYGENAQAQQWLDKYRYTQYRDSDLPLLERIAEGGGWPEGMIYDWIANWPRVKGLEAWRTGTGENLFESTAWYRARLEYLLLHRWPGQASQYGNSYHPYLSTGDTERNRGSIANYDRIMALILIERFPGEPGARQLQAYLAAPPADRSMNFMCQEEFLWFNSDQPTTAPGSLTHLARGTGTIFMRSGWPSGAADTDPGATYLTFQAGDHFTYHQHYDQNSFTLFKYGDLAVDSGVYSGDGRSNHDVNYYVRTIAHNTLVVYNPAEDFSDARPDASSNDGGQRTLYPASRSPGSVEYFDQHAVHYDTADLLHFEDNVSYTYALGDARKAYNNPTYYQAMDTGRTHNTAKVSRFQRELIYLRPQGAVADDYVVLYDRVGVVSAAFSGANTKLLFHTLGMPTVNGSPSNISPGEILYAGADLATATSGNGKLFIKVLLPASRNIRRVGGRGDKAFWVFGQNYDWHWGAGEAQPRPINDFEDVPYGEWRLELEPADAALEHNFLTVLYPTQSSTATMPATLLITGTGMSGAHIADPALNRLVLFSSAADGVPPVGKLSYSYVPTARALHVLVDLAPGAYYQIASEIAGGQLGVTLTPAVSSPYRTSSQGVLSFLLETNGDLPGSRHYLPLVQRE